MSGEAPIAQDGGQGGLEQALARTEADADAALKAAAAVTTALKRFRAAAHVGNLRELRPAVASAEQALDALRRQLDEAKGGWDFDEEAYFADGDFARELLETARRENVRIFELDDRLYCYPALIRVLPGDRTVLIDKARERRVRPSVLVDSLKDVQRRPARFRPEAFLEALYLAYSVSAAAHDDGQGHSRVEKLLDLYALFTLLPGQSREYSRQEFARDVYLLDQSGVTETRKGQVARFAASTGTRVAGSTLRVITRDGEEKLYYGVAFSSNRAD